MMGRKGIALVVAVLGLGWFLAGHGTGDKEKASGGAHGAGAKGGAVPVSVATAKKADIPIFLVEIGNVTPRSEVTVRALVNGELMSLPFTEGQMVKKDEMLAHIDDRPYAAALKQAEGNLKRDQALLEEAKINLDRYKGLWKQDSIAKQQLDTQASLVKQYEGAVLNDQGQADSAKVNLAYTKITSPVNGRAGLRQVDVGNIIHTTDSNGIVVVTELQPITVIFAIPEDNIPALMKQMAGSEKLVAEAWDRDNKNKLATGVLTAVDNQVDSTTGTVKARAEFANEDNALFPSQFVNIRLKLDTQKEAVTVPNAAVQRGVNGIFSYVVKTSDKKPDDKQGDDKAIDDKKPDDKKPEYTVSIQPISLGASDGGLTAITQGLSIGDQVVVDGTDNLRDGAKIEIAKNKDASGKDKDASNKEGDASGKDATKEGEPHKEHKKHKDASEKHPASDEQKP